ncbi:uncharacterized protein N0V89_001089 [Didymosphaeria variabile]|uniref:cyclic pyranopterin monophosphate synthase n=1 Tax=Didymosphaeria variabile TaxID=1932322 RepID=A0A9W8XYN3_9PLEO|nr:uncharacterized protein N0V89_001089 [Didymosphaeria variabile]KAJ4360524.1 hypothetical protein N0V89_001089 [Didymosphaeria variabile]
MPDRARYNERKKNKIRWRAVDGLSKATAGSKTAQIAAIRKQIKDLEWRLKFTKESPPHVADSSKFKVWQERVSAISEEKANRESARAMWRCNKKIASAAMKNEEHRKKLEHNWKAKVHELECTLLTCKYQLRRHAPNGPERLEDLDAEQLRLDEKAAKLREETMQVNAADEARAEKSAAKRAERRERESRKKDEERLERGHAKVQWDDSLCATWRRDIKAAQNAEAEGSIFLDAALSAQETEVPEMQSLVERRDALKKTLQETSRQFGEASTQLPRLQTQDSKAEKLIAHWEALRSQREPITQQYPRFLDRHRNSGQFKHLPEEEVRAIEGNLPEGHPASLEASSNSYNNAIMLTPEKRQAYDDRKPLDMSLTIAERERDLEKALSAVRDAVNQREIELGRKLTRNEYEHLRSIKRSEEYKRMRTMDFTGENNTRKFEPTARDGGLVHSQLEDIISKRQDPTAEVRQQQLRDIQQSVVHLKKLASAAKADGFGLATARKVEELLRELEKEAITVEQQTEPAVKSKEPAEEAVPLIRWSNQNPNAISRQSSRKEQAEKAAPVSGHSNQPQPLRAWLSPSPEVPPVRSLSDQLKAQLSPSQQVKIDDDLTVDVEADVPELQNQLFELSQRLKKDYPLMDTLPYDVWKSKQRKTLQTWLKILVWKWQTRNDDMAAESAEADPDVSQDVRALLDQMILDHDLDQRAAARMAKRWAEAFVRKEVRKLGVERSDAAEDLNWAQMDAGLGFLQDEGAAVDEERAKAWDTANAAKKDKRKPKQHIPEDLPFTWKGKGQGYRIGANHAWQAVSASAYHTLAFRRQYSSREGTRIPEVERDPFSSSADSPDPQPTPTLPHLTSSGDAHMVSVSSKQHTPRTAIATGTIWFSNPQPLSLIHSASNKKGDVLSVSRIAGIMAAKQTPSLVPLCHPISLTHVGVTLHTFPSSSPDHERNFGGIVVESKVQCVGQTGVEMEALTSVMGAALSVVDMCKAVDKSIRIDNIRVVLKEGGRSGTWREEGWESRREE